MSSGSACTSASLEPSYVLRALGVEEDMAHTSIRFGIGRFTTEAEVDRAVELTVAHVNKLREMSPLWEMVRALGGRARGRGEGRGERAAGWRVQHPPAACSIHLPRAAPVARDGRPDPLTPSCPPPFHPLLFHPGPGGH